MYTADAASAPAICGSPAAVTTEWLQSTLHHAGYDCELAGHEASRVGTGQVGQNIRFELAYRRGSGPASIVGKFASDDPESRQTGIALLNYLREVRFYQELRPTLDVQTPAVYFTDIDLDTHEFVLVMEDLAPAVQGDQIRGCQPGEAGLAVRELARLHGPRWSDPTLATHDWLGGQDEDSAAMIKGLWDNVYPGFLQRYGERMASAHVELTGALGGRFSSYLEGREGPRTVTHGDYRLDNLMFGGPYPVAVVDWQSPGLGLGTADVAYFMGTSLEAEPRRLCERDLVEEYHAELCSYGVNGYDLDLCWRDYRRSSLRVW